MTYNPKIVHCVSNCNATEQQAHHETEEYFDCSGLPAQSDSDFFKFKHAAFYGEIKSKLGLAFAKAAEMCVIMHIDKSPSIVMG